MQTCLGGSLGHAVFLDRSCRYRFANREFLDFIGKSDGDVIGREVSAVLGDALHATYAQMLERLPPGESVRREGWTDYGSFGRRYVEELITAYPPDGDPPSGVIVFSRDLTELKNREQDLLERVEAQNAVEAYHAVVVNTALDAIVVIDEAGIVVDFNPAAVSVFGYSRDQAMGSQIADLIIPPALRSAHDCGMKSYLESGVSRVLGQRLELEALRADGGLIPIELTITDVTRGPKRLFAAHLRDLTAARKAQAEIASQRDALHQKEKLAALGSLLAGVAHELNNPLSIVMGHAMMLREKLANGPSSLTQSEDLAKRSVKIEEAANRCARIVRSFLDMARQRKTERQAILLPDLVGKALDLLSYNLQSSGVIVETDFPGGLPPIWVDGDQIHQVVVNLVINACQALEEKGDGDRRIRIAAEPLIGAGMVLLGISDNGPGIPASIRSRIFDPYFTTKPQGTGTGIGLAVSRGLIEAHGGTLDIDEASTGGARFVIRLPVGESTPGTGDGVSSRVEAVPAAARRHVLVIDDETDIAELLSDMAGSLGFDVSVAGSGQAAKALLEQGDLPLSAILCDIRMPNGDGPAFYDWLRETRPELATRIGFVTGDTLGPAAGRFLARSGCPMIEKPFTPDDIARILTSLTAGLT
ncbi:hybrid sensor histidine kinase/response regulator [Bosea sp. PAMC 26642]|uniref:hybrid sensor histidine kinase/response regulator n=1 Tax=Bosea sp. (strain PAMC 26642) TaxID=1792307 RepID=UPI00143A2F5C|nr:PAS domain S-box protein [Bosea sp. PAMC 26642]